MNAEIAQEDSEQFFAGTYRRIVRIQMGAVPLVAALLWFLFNHRFSLGFLAGGAISILNFLSLKKLVTAFADRVIERGVARNSSGLVLRFLLRYGIIAASAYAIFRNSAMSAYGLLAGLAVPALAIMVEAVYELYAAVRHGY